MMINALSSTFSASIDDVLKYAARFHKQQAFIVVVLDHVNEQQNHIEDLASQLYPILKRNVRATDMIIRFSQDSWVICLDDCTERLLQWTQYVIESMLYRRKLKASKFSGVLTSVRGTFLKENNVAKATKAIEHEIECSKNILHKHKVMHTTAIGFPESSNKLMETLPLINQGIIENRLFLAFQPIVDTHSRQLYYYECLARLVDDQGQIVPAAHFIPQCEKSGLIQLIDQKIQQLALEELMNDRHVRLAINVSAITACESRWLDTLKAQMRARPDLQGRLIVELTETSVFQNINESIEFMTQLHDLGCPISIDDFGAGYMSLLHLKSDLVQTVKIDAQFVKDLKADSNNIHFIRAIMALTQPYGIKCVAEGVEDAPTAQALAQENVEYLQGYHIGKPSHFRSWI
jgi:EAL domain-containing protein (putative c-di-GMP-specific phosphodiesterase class I)/GGDEF domain-containing protein